MINKDFRDSLIIDKYDNVFQKWREQKLKHLRSENSEDAVTWNVFRTLKQIDPQQWLPQLYKLSFQKDFTYPTEFIDVVLWKRLKPPINLSAPEGPSKIDVIIESNEFVWFIEAKYKSDIKMRTNRDKTRNQVIRNIDVGLDYAKGKNFYFSLLILDERHSPKGVYTTYEYMNSINLVGESLVYRNNTLENLKGIGIISWFDILSLLSNLNIIVGNEFERFIAKNAESWLRNKITNSSAIKNGAILDETRTYR